jgi:glucose-1-phosphate thymidylyltransferase
MGRAEEFVGNHSVAVILGDNIFEDNFKGAVHEFSEGGLVFLKDVHDPERFGVVDFDEDQQIKRIIEKPEIAPSPYAVTGLYLYDSKVFDIIRTLQPSARGELEVTDLNNAYIQQNSMKHVIISGSWSDMGTFESLYEASTIARSMVMKALKKSQSTHRSLLYPSFAGLTQDALHDV